MKRDHQKISKKVPVPNGHPHLIFLFFEWLKKEMLHKGKIAYLSSIQLFKIVECRIRSVEEIDQFK